MFLSRRLLILLLTAIATGLFTACGNSDNGNNNFSMPANDTTKVSPTPTTAATATIQQFQIQKVANNTDISN
jgi:hypothetical protein